MPQLIEYGFLLFAAWLIKRDMALRPGVSNAVWLPTLWVGIIASRPLSFWTGLGGGFDTLDGSPVDRMFYLTIIVASLLVLHRRNVNFGWIMARTWPVVLFYLFLLISVTWANSLEASFKRWFKETGNILVALVILTEANPTQAIRAVFVRVATVLIPLSLIYIRYFPHLGRRYNIHSGEMEAVGVTMQKNSLGTMLLVCGIVFIWDWLERTRADARGRTWIDRAVALAIAGIGVWLFSLCDSKTSIVSLCVAGIIIAAIRMPVFHSRVSAFGAYGILAVIAFFAIDHYIGIVESIVHALGRDMTFTGRTEVWKVLLNVGTDSMFGTGFMSFWDDPDFKAKLPNWVAFSAHNGYVEVFLAGGMIGLFFLGIMLLGTGVNINRDLQRGGDYAVVRFAVLCATLMANFAESNFACMTPLGFLFLIAAIGYATPQQLAQPVITVPGDESRLAPSPSAPPDKPLDARPQFQ